MLCSFTVGVLEDTNGPAAIQRVLLNGKVCTHTKMAQTTSGNSWADGSALCKTKPFADACAHLQGHFTEVLKKSRPSVGAEDLAPFEEFTATYGQVRQTTPRPSGARPRASCLVRLQVPHYAQCLVRGLLTPPRACVAATSQEGV